MSITVTIIDVAGYEDDQEVDFFPLIYSNDWSVEQIAADLCKRTQEIDPGTLELITEWVRDFCESADQGAIDVLRLSRRLVLQASPEPRSYKEATPREVKKTVYDMKDGEICTPTPPPAALDWEDEEPKKPKPPKRKPHHKPRKRP